MTRRTLLALQARVADLLLAHERAPEWRRRELVQELEAETELLWLTAEVQRDRPSVMDEVGNTLWYLEDRLVHAASRVRQETWRAFIEEFGQQLDEFVPVRFGSWVGVNRTGILRPPERPIAAARARLRHPRRVSSRRQALVDVLPVGPAGAGSAYTARIAR